jgi:Protein of unknown function (DUF2800)
LSTIRDAHKVNNVISGIIQPRSFSPDGSYRTVVNSVSYYENIVQPKIDNGILASQQPDAPFVPGAVQCKFCPIKTNCKAREAAALSVVSTDFANVKDVSSNTLPAVSGMTPDRLAYVMSAADVLEDWISDVKAAAYNMAKAGTYIPGFKLVEAQARRHWHQDEDTTAMMLMSLTGKIIEEVMPRKLLGITDAEKLVVDSFKAKAGRGLKRKAAEDAGVAFAHLTTKESSGNLVLVTESDKRPAVNAAQKAFTNVALPVK